MESLEYLIKIAIDAAPQKSGFQIQPLYVLLNLTIPILLGILLNWINRLIEKGWVHLLGERR